MSEQSPELTRVVERVKDWLSQLGASCGPVPAVVLTYRQRDELMTKFAAALELAASEAYHACCGEGEAELRAARAACKDV